MTKDEVIGAVLEIGVSQGVDRLAVYANRSARYESAAGATIDWQRPDASLDAQLDGLLTAATEALGDTAPMDPAALSGVRFGEARIVLLTPDVVRGVQGSLVALSGNARLKNVLLQGSVLIGGLVASLGGAAVSA